jgi:hypothetical protein
MAEFERWPNSHDGGIGLVADFTRWRIVGKAEYATWHNSRDGELREISMRAKFQHGGLREQNSRDGKFSRWRNSQDGKFREMAKFAR